MTIRNLDHMFAPKSVALIGASPELHSIGRIIAENLLAGGFRGPTYLVNPHHRELLGRQVFSTVADLPIAPDLAVVATPPASVPGIIAELGAKGTRAAVVITAGVRSELRQQMLDAAKPYVMRLQGPNCIGLILPEIGLNASFSHCMPVAGDLALVSQSGALVTAVLDWAQSRNIGFSHVVSLGDMADVDFGDMLDYLAGDLHTRAILLYMEHLTHAAKFMSAARRAARSKPVIVIKAGRHADGARAAQSHTGALSGSDGAYDTAFRRAGMLRVAELEDLFNAAEMLSRASRLPGERLAIVTNGGGAGVLAADRLADLDGILATLDPRTLSRLDAVLPATWSRGNPVDIIGDADAKRYSAALDILSDANEVDAILAMYCPTALTSSRAIADAVIATRSKRRVGQLRSPTILTNWLGDQGVAESRDIFTHEQIATFDTPADAIEGFMQLVAHQRAQAQLLSAPPSLAEALTPETGAANRIVADAISAGKGMMSEVEAKALLAAYGIPVVPTFVATSPATVAAVAEQLLRTDSACVVKILSDDIIHKSDVGGVRLSLTSPSAAENAAQMMLEAISRQFPKARLSGFTVQPMVQRTGAHELILGMADDQTFGPVVMFGAGGVAVEVMQDTVLALPPLDLKLARDLINQTRVVRLLRGYRDRPAADIDAIALTLVKLSALLIAHPEVIELDINPLLADDNGVTALDARVRVADPAVLRRRPLVIRPYPAQWERIETLNGIGEVELRPIKPTDAVLYVDLIRRLQPEDMRMRFFIARPNLSPDMIARLTQIDYAREMAFAAIDRARGSLIGVGRLMADPDYSKAEFAVIVASDLKGRGLGWKLMQLLISYAEQEGVPIYDVRRLEELLPALNVQMAILAVPAEAAQGLVNRLAELGISGILNFAPVSLSIPERVQSVDVDLAVELQRLAFAVVNAAPADATLKIDLCGPTLRRRLPCTPIQRM